MTLIEQRRRLQVACQTVRRFLLLPDPARVAGSQEQFRLAGYLHLLLCVCDVLAFLTFNIINLWGYF
jgi:hypothetical protein